MILKNSLFTNSCLYYKQVKIISKLALAQNNINGLCARLRSTTTLRLFVCTLTFVMKDNSHTLTN